MRLCIPTINERGLTARLSPHFGSAPYHTVIESDSGGGVGDSQRARPS